MQFPLGDHNFFNTKMGCYGEPGSQFIIVKKIELLLDHTVFNMSTVFILWYDGYDRTYHRTMIQKAVVPSPEKGIVP